MPTEPTLYALHSSRAYFQPPILEGYGNVVNVAVLTETVGGSIELSSFKPGQLS